MGREFDPHPAEPKSRASGDRAWSAAVRLIAARPLTRKEVSERLARRGHDEPQIEEVLERLTRQGYVRDDELAWHYIVTRSTRLGHGKQRLVDELRRRGVDAETAEAAWRRAVNDGDIDPDALLRRALERRTGADVGTLDRRAYRRVYNALLRAGFDASAVRRLLGQRGEGSAVPEHHAGQGTDDEFA